MKKRILKLVCLLCSAILLFGVTACGSNTTGNSKSINFWGYGTEVELELTRELVAEFNATNTQGITVNYTPVRTGDYEQKIRNALAGRSVPDVIMAGDGEIKPWIERGGLATLDEFAAASDVIDIDAMYQEGVNRFRYDIDQRRGGEGDLYGILRDLSPTALFYNKKAFAAVGVEILTLSAEEQMEQYGTDAAYFEHNGQKYFSNQIALNWDELLELSQLLTSNEEAPVRNDRSITKYGIYVTNWFGFGWSVGGDCLEWVEDPSLPRGGKYEFTLFDETANYSVKEDQTVTVNGTTYTAGQIIEYTDKDDLTEADKAKCYELPSQLDAMEYFVDLSANWGVSPRPDVTASSSSHGVFTSGQVAMLAAGVNSMGILRSTIYPEDHPAGFDWDVAPWPKAEHGIASGHSGSVAYCIPEKSNKKEAAWAFIEYAAGEPGQAKYAQAGFSYPNTKELAQKLFIQEGAKPANAAIFFEAAEYQRMGDWGYLPSKAWITEWSNDLNTKVLGGEMTLQQLKAERQESTQAIIDGYYDE